MSKPMSEAELRDRVGTILGENPSLEWSADVDNIVALILSDRKAWGEYVIGLDEAEYGNELYPAKPGAAERNALRAEQRQRNTSGGDT